MDNEMSSLNLRLDELRNRIASNKKKYYHLRSISNFIYHINSQKLIDRKFVLDKLREFMDFLESNQIDDIHDSLIVFNTFLRPIGELYERDLGFFVMIKPWILNIWVLFFLLVVSFFDKKIYFLYFFILLSIFAIYMARKIYGRKVYAFMW